MESMSNVPHYLPGSRRMRLGHGEIVDGLIKDGGCGDNTQRSTVVTFHTVYKTARVTSLATRVAGGPVETLWGMASMSSATGSLSTGRPRAGSRGVGACTGRFGM